MATRQPQAPGGRQIRHVVKVTPEQEARLQELAKGRNISVARLLVDTTLDAVPETSAELIRQVSGLRKQLSNSGYTKFDDALAELLDR